MMFREVTMLEVKEVLRLWLAQRAKKAIARQVGVDRNTVRRYIKAAISCGVSEQDSERVLTDDRLATIIAQIRVRTGSEHARGDTWSECTKHKAFIEKKLDAKVQLTKVRRLLIRQGVNIPYATLHRFACCELNFGRVAPTIPVADCQPGEEVQVDTGQMTLLEPDVFGRRRRFKAWIFTSVLTRHRFVHVCFHETTRSAIEACEAAWGSFLVAYSMYLSRIIPRPSYRRQTRFHRSSCRDPAFCSALLQCPFAVPPSCMEMNGGPVCCATSCHPLLVCTVV